MPSNIGPGSRAIPSTSIFTGSASRAATGRTALKAEKLVFLTDVAGLRADPDDPGSLLHRVTAEQLDAATAAMDRRWRVADEGPSILRAIRGALARPAPASRAPWIGAAP